LQLLCPACPHGCKANALKLRPLLLLLLLLPAHVVVAVCCCCCCCCLRERRCVDSEQQWPTL